MQHAYSDTTLSITLDFSTDDIYISWPRPFYTSSVDTVVAKFRHGHTETAPIAGAFINLPAKPFFTNFRPPKQPTVPLHRDIATGSKILPQARFCLEIGGRRHAWCDHVTSSQGLQLISSKLPGVDDDPFTVIAKDCTIWCNPKDANWVQIHPFRDRRRKGDGRL